MNTSATTVRSGGARRQRAAALFPHGDQWQLVVGEGNGRLRVVATQTLPRGATESLASVLASHRVERLVRVVPAARCVSRLVDVESRDEAEAAEALALQAEAQLPSSLPDHRRSWGLTQAPGRSGARAGLVAGWMESDADVERHAIDTVWTSEVAILALALDRESGSVIHADGDTGTIAIVASDGRSSAVRTLREDHSSPEAWRRSLERAISETGRLQPVEPEAFARNGSARAFLVAPELRRRLAERIEGMPADDPKWMSRFAVPTLALAAWLHASPATEPFFRMKPAAPVQRRSPAQRLTSWLADPAHAWTVVAVCVLLMALSPLAIAGARLAVLRAKAGSLEELQAAQALVDQQVTLHRELEQRRWPMTSLLAHLAGAVPPEVEVKEVRLDAGQRFSLEGVCPSDEIVNTLQSNLNSLGIFGPVSIEQSEPMEGRRSVSFEVRGTVQRPYARTVRFFEDYTEQTLALRLYGVDTTGQAPAARASADDDDGDSASGERGNRFRPGSASTTTRREPAPRPSDARPASAPTEIPPPVTEELLATLKTREEVIALATKYSDASGAADIDDATRERLKADRMKLLRHLQKVK